MKVVCFACVLLLAACSTTAGWKVRFNDGIYTSPSGSFQLASPVPASFCLKIEESASQSAETVAIADCHGYIQGIYIVDWVDLALPAGDKFKEFCEWNVERTKDTHFRGLGQGHLVRSWEEMVGTKPAFHAELENSDSKFELHLRTSCVWFDSAIAYVILASERNKTSPGASFAMPYARFIETISATPQ